MFPLRLMEMNKFRVSNAAACFSVMNGKASIIRLLNRSLFLRSIICGRKSPKRNRKNPSRQISTRDFLRSHLKVISIHVNHLKMISIIDDSNHGVYNFAVSKSRQRSSVCCKKFTSLATIRQCERCRVVRRRL